jgi:hypothetical protein
MNSGRRGPWPSRVFRRRTARTHGGRERASAEARNSLTFRLRCGASTSPAAASS